MKRVLFDGTSTQSSSRAAFHGGGEYAKYMLRAAIERGHRFDVVLGKWLHTDPMIEQLLSENLQINQFYVENKKELYDLIENNAYEVFYSVLPSSYSDYRGSAQLIGVIHGLRSAELPWDYYRYKYETRLGKRIQAWLISHSQIFQRYLKQRHIAQSQILLNVRNAKYIAVSNHTKNSMLAFYPELKPENIRVFYSPFSVKQIAECREKDNYFLMVSGNRYEKNVYRAVKVFDKLFSDGRLNDKRVVITGSGKQPFWNELNNKDRFDLKPYVSSEELDNLYQHAFCFVYPSLNEGFGYPPLQAMAYGTPVIASSATSIPEVCDNAACYFAPANADDLAARILRIDGDAGYRTMLAERGLKRVAVLQKLQEEQLGEELEMIFNTAEKNDSDD